MCVFCDERSDAFTDEGLVKHYWGDCVMLANCPFCKIVSSPSLFILHIAIEVVSSTVL